VIVTSLLLILAAVTLLVLGLISGSSQQLVGSIAASLLAAIALVIGARQSAASRARDGRLDEVDGESVASAADLGRVPTRERVAAGAPGRSADDRPAYDQMAHDRTATGEAVTERFSTVAPPQGMPDPDFEASHPPTGSPAGMAPPPLPEVPVEPPRDTGPRDDDIDGEEDPPDEPVPQQVSPADAARVAQMSTPVMVVDGRPRYHLAGCVHLFGRDSEPLPVAEAVELGFTPCSLCEPDTSLLADAR
jgi:hypothetical protein